MGDDRNCRERASLSIKITVSNHAHDITKHMQFRLCTKREGFDFTSIVEPLFLTIRLGNTFDLILFLDSVRVG